MIDEFLNMIHHHQLVHPTNSYLFNSITEQTFQDCCNYRTSVQNLLLPLRKSFSTQSEDARPKADLQRLLTLFQLLSSEILLHPYYSSWDDLLFSANSLKFLVILLGLESPVLEILPWKSCVFPTPLQILEWNEHSFKRDAKIQEISDMLELFSNPALLNLVLDPLKLTAEQLDFVLTHQAELFDHSLVKELLTSDLTNLEAIITLLLKLRESLNLDQYLAQDVKIDPEEICEIDDATARYFRYKNGVFLSKKIKCREEGQIKRAVTAMKMLNACANTAKTLGYFHEKDDYFLLTELPANGSLYCLLKYNPNIAYEKKIEMAMGLSNGLCAVHRLKVIHRNLMSTNILVHGDLTVVISGFERATCVAIEVEDIEKEFSEIFVNSVAYKAPETFGGAYSQSSDIYAFSVILWELFKGRAPFNGEQDECLVEAQIQAGVRPGEFTDLEPNLANIINACWGHPNKRPRAFQILEKLKRIGQKNQWLLEITNSINSNSALKDIFNRIKKSDLENAEKEELLKYVLDFIKNDISDKHNLSVESKKSVDFRGQYGRTILHITASKGIYKMVKHLILEVEMDPNITDKNGDNVLHCAAMGGNLDIIRFLVEYVGMDLRLRGYLGRTILHTAASKGHLRLVQWLVKIKRMNPHEVDVDKNNALHCAGIGGSLDVAKWLLQDQHMDASVGGLLGRNVLLTAASKGRIELFKWLIEEWGMDGYATDTGGNNALHCSSIGGKLEIVQWLIKRGMDYKVGGKYGRTALHSAAEFGHLKLVEYLITLVPDLRYLSKLLDSHGNNVLHCAVIGGRMEVAKWLVQQLGMDLTAQGYMGRSLVHLAASKGHLEIMKWLVALDVSSLASTDDNGDNALHCAVMAGKFPMVKWLVLEAKMDLHAEGQHGNAINTARACDKSDIMDWLCGVSGLSVAGQVML